MNGRDTAAAAANLPNDKDAAVMFTVTALNDEEDGLERCVFRLEATAPATHAVQLPYYEGAPQFWQCADAAGATIRYSGMMKKRKPPPPYIDIAAGKTAVIAERVSLQHSFGATCQHQPPFAYSYKGSVPGLWSPPAVGE